MFLLGSFKVTRESLLRREFTGHSNQESLQPPVTCRFLRRRFYTNDVPRSSSFQCEPYGGIKRQSRTRGDRIFFFEASRLGLLCVRLSRPCTAIIIENVYD